MVEGESGILAISPPDEGPRYVSSKRRIVWPNGAIAALYSADEPRRLRGPQHDAAWCDELAAWRYPEAWDMLMFGLRSGPDPRAVVTTTPRPTRLLREFLADPTVAVTRGTTWENSEHLAPAFLSQIVRKYQGTRLGRQELEAAVHASRGKIARAEPIAALYAQGKVRHLGAFPVLEDQMCGFVRDPEPWTAGAPPASSPDRVDALVWALSELLVQPMPHAGFYEL